MTYALHTDSRLPSAQTQALPAHLVVIVPMVMPRCQTGSPKARLVEVRLDCIHLRDPADVTTAIAPLTLKAEPEAERIANLLRPPLLIADDSRPGHYIVVANRSTYLRQLQLAGTDADRPKTITAVVLKSGDSKVATVAPLIEAYLVPLIVGALSVRKQAAARRKLLAAGLTPPKPITTRASVRRLVRRPAVDGGG